MFKHSLGTILFVLGMTPLAFGQVIRPDTTRSQDALAGLPFLDLSDAGKARAASTISSEEVERANRYDKPRRPTLFDYDEPQKSGERFLAGRYDPSGSRDSLPVKDGDLIVTGQVVDSTPHLAKGGGAVYSTFRIKLLEPIMVGPLPAGRKELNAEREGGVVLYPSGKKRLEGILSEGLPIPGYTYLLFLKKTPTFESYSIIRDYALVGNKVFPLDKADYSEQNLDAARILAQVRSQFIGR